MNTSEKQKKAKQLYTQYHIFCFTNVSFVGHYNREATAHVCDVNGYRCCLVSDLSHLSECVRKCYDCGLLSRNDFLAGRRGDGGNAGGRSCTVLKLDALKAIREEYLKMRWTDKTVYGNYIQAVENAKGVVSESISAEEIEKLWDIYDERQQLITESSRERKEEKQRKEWEEAGYIEPEQQKDDLSDLVDRIEALGWHVTLTRKEGA